MKIETLENFLTEIVVPMFPGSSLEKSNFVPKKATTATVAYDHAPTKLRVRQNSTAKNFFPITRLQSWEDTEKRLVKKLLAVFGQTQSTAAALLNQLEDYVTRIAIAQTVATGKQAETLESILETLSAWASQTYEGERVSSGILVTSAVGSGTAKLSLLDLMKEDFGKVLSDGVDSWWQVDAAGVVQTFSTTDSTTAAASERGYFPLRYLALASRAIGNEVAVTLNRNGEILLFAEGELKFSKRRGRWLHFAHKPVVTSMSWGGASAWDVRDAIYESCLDASFARSGGCIGIVRKHELTQFDTKCPVSNDDLLTTAAKLKPLSAAQLISGKVFQSIPRLVRKELLGLDGAIVLRWDGIVLAAGAILELQDVKRGNQGGRSAAAKALSRFGMGIKISEDGMISGYKIETGEDDAAFKLG